MKVAGALETFPGNAPTVVLERLCGDEGPTVRRSAVRALRKRKDPLLLDLLPYLVEDSLVWVRSEALRSVGELTGVDPEGCRNAVPLIVSCFETPWPGEAPDPTSSAAQSWDAARTDVIEACALSLNRVAGRAYGFRPEELLDWKRRAQVASALAADDALRAKAVARWRESYAPWPEEKRIPPLVKRLDDRDPDCVLRAMRELARLTKDTTGFPAGVLERSGDDTPNRNLIREWAKGPEKAKCLEHWRRAR
jgi:HEAT repeat protein